MGKIDEIYRGLVADIHNEGVLKKNRTGIDTYSKFGMFFKVDLEDGFPLLTTKKINFRNIVAENVWFLSGSTNIKKLQEYTHIWDDWADDKGNVDANYGFNWRKREIDQIQRAVTLLKNDPCSRRIVIDAWHAPTSSFSKLPPCHYSFVFNATPYHETYKLNCHVTMRSNDIALGLPYNIAGYALLTHLMAAECDLMVGELAFSLVDAHIYVNHMEQLMYQVSNLPYSSPSLLLGMKTILNLTWDNLNDVALLGYNSHPALKYDVAV